ncbi:dihydrofolate reductase [Agromyces terreus]|uniref:Dihydrofolate reductase n=1 Tax=Agromyces terreus TaxID=424795 RepID=A0A9X2GWP1_9MICO|nr:dihydrofolate reductase family protein [Agromyces terreus]MCP2370057.1 dihydrofolate reductase [Agromyces terreus]
MGRLIYTAISSLDGYVADAEGRFDWSMPSEDVHAAVNRQQRGIGTMLLGRRMYEVLVAWEHMDVEGAPEVYREYAELWRSTDKVVYSATLDLVGSSRTRIERAFDPDEVRDFVAASDHDVSISGPTLAAHALRAGIVDEVGQYLGPVVVGGGVPVFAPGLRLDLELVEEQRFPDGVVYLGYRPAAADAAQ